MYDENLSVDLSSVSADESITASNGAVFTPSPEGKVPLSVTRHSSKLNTNLTLKIPGILDLSNVEDLPNDAPKHVETFRYKTVSLIKDGKVNLDRFTVTDQDGVKSSYTSYLDDPFQCHEKVSASADPLDINDQIIDTVQSLCYAAAKVTSLKISKKVLESLTTKEEKADLEPWKKHVGVKTDGSFSDPKREYYREKKSEFGLFEVQIRLAKMSARPPVSKAKEKVKSGKRLSLSEGLVIFYIRQHDGLDTDGVQSESIKVQNEIGRLTEQSYWGRSRLAHLRSLLKEGEMSDVDSCNVSLTDSNEDVWVSGTNISRTVATLVVL